LVAGLSFLIHRFVLMKEMENYEKVQYNWMGKFCNVQAAPRFFLKKI
jgi:hypothetical protein